MTAAPQDPASDEALAGARGLPAPLYTLLYLPGGLCDGFVSVALAYELSRHGVSVADIATLVALNRLPTAWKFVAGPIIDTSLTSRRWYLACMLALVVALLALASTPLTEAAMPLLSLIAFSLGAAGSAAGSSATAAMVLVTPRSRRGAVAGWVQVGSLGGVGLGGGLGLWLASHAGGLTVAALILSGVSLGCAAPILLMRFPHHARLHALGPRLEALAGSVWGLMRTREGVLASLVCVLPAGLGAASVLMPAVASDWRAPADLVAAVTGGLSGLFSVPGALAGGYLCARFSPRPVYVCAALACALIEAMTAWAPHTPSVFAVMVLANAVILGVAWSSVSAVVFEQLGRAGAATNGAILSSLSNLPVVVMIKLVGQIHARHGANAMLLSEAGAAVAAIGAYVAIAVLWRSAPAPSAVVLAAAG